MRLATVAHVGLALLLGTGIAGCDSATATHADGSGRADTDGPADGASRSDASFADVRLALDTAPPSVEDGPAAPEGDAFAAEVTSGNDDASGIDASRIADGAAEVRGRTDGSDARHDGTFSPEGPVPGDGPPRSDAPAGPEVLAPPDGPAGPDRRDAGDRQPPSPDVPPPDSTAVAQVTIAIVGDTAEKGRTSHTRAVASLINDHSPAVAGLFIAGDCVRYDGMGSLLGFFQKYWEPVSEANMGQFNNLVFPQLGNHEYLETDAQGYFDYFAARLAAITELPDYHGDVGRVGRGWYSVDVNGWHVVSLNANCDEISGGCRTGGAQEQWLSADLADHAGMPIIALWHEPRWTCTPDGHSSEADVQPLWAKLYDAHADFVFNGHNHFYQRYKPLNKASTAAEDQAAGITQIIVGTGGSSTYDVCSASEDSRVAKALDGDGSMGAMFFTMGSDGSYRWEFRRKSDGSVFDSGAGRSHNAK